MKIVVLQGSPRKAGHTVQMVEGFAKGAREAGHEVEIIPVADKKIGGCLGCMYCQNQGQGTCVQNDDMGPILDTLWQCDMVVIAAPIYYATLSAQMQVVIQRTYARGPVTAIKKSALIVSADWPGMFEAAAWQYKTAVVDYWQTEDMGIFTANMQEGEEASPAGLAKKLYEFGKAL